MDLGSSHRTLRQQVAEEVRRRIVAGTYPPGSRLVEDQVAADLGVSRNPVREALQSLASDGFVSIVPRRGAVVRRLTEQDVNDLFDVRRSLESLAARLAAERYEGGSEVALRSILGEARSASRRRDYDRLAELNSDFHQQIVADSGNELLVPLVRSLAWRTRWLFRPSAAMRAPHSWREHLGLVEVIEAGNGPLAAQLAADHVERARASALDEVLRQGTGVVRSARRHRPTA